MSDGASVINSQIASGLQTSIGAYYTARADQSNLNASANIADLNARMSDLSAQSALMQGERQQQASMMQTTQVKDAQKTGFAANGIALDSETANRVLTSTDVLGAVDANTIAANAMRSAFGYRMEGVNYSNEALTKRASAKAISPLEDFSTSLVNSASSVASTWFSLGKSGALAGTKYGDLYNQMSGKNAGSSEYFPKSKTWVDWNG